jgi:hypothetical protein
VRDGPLALNRQAEQRAVDLAAVAGHDNRLLAEVASLGVADGPRRQPDLDDETVLVHVLAVDRRAGFDAEDLERLQPCRAGARTEESLPGGNRLVAWADNVVTRNAKHVGATDMAGDGTELPRHHVPFRQIGEVVPKNLQDFRGAWPG